MEKAINALMTWAYVSIILGSIYTLADLAVRGMLW